MIFIPTLINDLFIIETEPYIDSRGFFERLYCEKELKAINHTKKIVQVNHSVTSKKGSIRGMHFQHPPFGEIKLIRCIRGSVYDVAVDIRANSPTFLKWHAEILSFGNNKMLYIPEGFAHGFQTLVENCELLYFHSNFFDKEHESGLRFDDPLINVTWPLPIGEISERDRSQQLLDLDFKGIDT